jgi:hypothetical protein
MSATLLLSELAARGIRVRLVEDGKLGLTPRGRLTPDLIDRIRAHKTALLARLAAERERTETESIAHFDQEGREADREAQRGYDVDCDAPSHADYLEHTGQRCGCQSPARGIVATCRRYGVALRIDATTGDLVVGKAGAKADQPSQPWPSLLVALEAHLEAVATLVASGWALRAEFPERGAA